MRDRSRRTTWCRRTSIYRDRIGEVYSVTFNPAHRWFYYPAMSPSEVLLIKTYDSSEDGRARFTAHTAFTHPTTAPGAAARESIEVRALVCLRTPDGRCG